MTHGGYNFCYFMFAPYHVNGILLLIIFCHAMVWNMGIDTYPMAWFKLTGPLKSFLDELHVWGRNL